ncbi:MAG: class I SAM-dependent methyltransferase [Leptospiraceae bacterium]|nr:class I SAM-dependent methyltransferase [Leptospiraceae bacterium]
MQLYSRLAEYYFEIERTGRNFSEEIEFLDFHFKRFQVKKALDIGCGTGEHVSALNQKSYNLTGLDSSQEMLGIAKKRFPNSEFFLSPMQSFEMKQTFDAVTSIYGSLNYLVKDSEIHSCLDSVRGVLKTSGVFIVELWNGEPIRRIKRKAMSPVSMTRIGSILIQRNRGFKLSSKIEEDTGLENLVEVNFSFQVNDEEIRDKHLMRVFSPVEFQTFLQKHKFEILNLYSSYQMDKFTETAGKMIFIVRKKL